MLKVLHSFFLRAFSSALFANRSQIILSLYAKRNRNTNTSWFVKLITNH